MRADAGADGGNLGIDYADEGGYAGSQYQDDGGWAGNQYNETAENANTTAQYAAGEPTNTTENVTNATTSHMLSTGNPALLIMGATAILGGCVVALRKR